MFGYIKPVAAELKVKEYELYRSIYCGLCRSMGRNTACISRLSLSYDFVFLALIRLILAGESGRIVRHRCIAHPAKKRSVLTDSAQLDYCARASALLTYGKIRDDITDEKGYRKLAARCLLPAAGHIRRRALKTAPEGTDLEALCDTVARELANQAALETEGCPSPDKAAEPFGRLMAAVCACGFTEGSTEYRLAREIGRHIGRFVYLADAIDDRETDKKNGSYNPFLAAYGADDADAAFLRDRDSVRSALTMELIGAEAAIDLMDCEALPEYGNIIRNTVYLGLPAVIDRLLTDPPSDGKPVKSETENMNL